MPNGSTTFTATYGSVSATFTVNYSTYLFRDGGVTGDVNTNYTDLNGTINAQVSSTGTTISCSTYADWFRRANVLVSGDFEAEYTITAASGDSCGISMLSTTNEKLLFFEANNSKVLLSDYLIDVVSNTNYRRTNVIGKTVKFARDSGVIKVYLDDVEVLSYNSNITQDIYLAFKTHSAGGRYFTFRDFTISNTGGGGIST